MKIKANHRKANLISQVGPMRLCEPEGFYVVQHFPNCGPSTISINITGELSKVKFLKVSLVSLFSICCPNGSHELSGLRTSDLFWPSGFINEEGEAGPWNYPILVSSREETTVRLPGLCSVITITPGALSEAC